jgi:hypothetical protein
VAFFRHSGGGIEQAFNVKEENKAETVHTTAHLKITATK